MSDRLVSALLAAREREIQNPRDEANRVASRKAKQALARELGGEEHISLAIEIYRFEQKQAAERDNAAARVRFDLDEPYDAGWRWREFLPSAAADPKKDWSRLLHFSADSYNVPRRFDATEKPTCRPPPTTRSTSR